MKNTLIILSIAAVAMIQSCAPIYIPSNHNVPLFTEKGEIQLGAAHGTNGTNLQAAVSVIDHLAVMGNFAFAVRETSDSSDYRKHSFYDLGLGYYNTFGGKGRYEVYGGYGRGVGEAYDNYTFISPQSVTARGKYDRLFLQGNLGLGNEVFEGAISYRVSYLSFYEFEQVSTSTPVNFSTEEIMMEPAITLKVGGPNFKFLAQFGFSFPYDSHVDFDYQPFNMSFGIMGKIPAW